jgi:4'-phosphopantetheinyl transferase EntD
MIAALFDADVVAVEAGPDAWEGTLLPEEEPFVARAVERRRREFTAGRTCARRALAALGIEGFPILVGEDRAPVWPEGIVGSIAHCDGYCGAVAARRGAILGLGLDVERADPLDARTRELVCTASERARLGAGAGAGRLAKAHFSAKESVYKCVGPILGRFLEFHEVEIDLDAGAGLFTARLRIPETLPGGAGRLDGRVAWGADHVFTGATLRRPPAAPSASSG